MTTGNMAFAQTSYTWTGASSSNWLSSGNWSPAGVPTTADNVTIVSSSNNPVLAATDTVNKLTITSGTLDLGGYDLRVQHQLTVSGSAKTNVRATNGRIVNRTNQGSTITHCKMDCILDLQPGSLTMTTTRVTDSLLLLVTNTSGFAGCIFDDFVRVEKTAGMFSSGYLQPDTFKLGLTVRILSTGTEQIYLAHSSSGNYIDGDLILENLNLSGTYNLIQSGSSSDTTYRITVSGDVKVSNLGPSTSKVWLFGMKVVDGGTMEIGSSGFANGTLQLTRCHLMDTDTLRLVPRQAATVAINYSTLYGPLRLDSATYTFDHSKLLAGCRARPTGGNGWGRPQPAC